MPEKNAGVHHQAAEKIHPVAEIGQARKGHIPGTDEQRNQVKPESLHEGHGEEVEHGRAVHREDAVVGVRA
jgi:hypothetical protein